MDKNILIAGLLVSVIALVVVLTLAFSLQSSLPFFGRIIVQQAATTCNESDNGVFFYTKGKVSMCTGTSCIDRAEDFCANDVLSEQYCSEKNEIKIMNLKCPYGCDDGACLTIGQLPKPKPQPAPQPQIQETEAPEEEVKEIVCSEGWTCLNKIKVYQDVSCEWIKEEYCAYGCIEGACKMAGFWEKFLAWIKEQVK